MITRDLIQGLYAFNSDSITTNELNILGFNSHDIKKLVDEGYLIRQKRGTYSRALDKEREYLKEQMKMDNGLISSIIMNRMLEREDSIDSAFYIARLYIQNREYDSAFKLLDYIYKHKHDEKTHKAVVYSLYMLGQIIELPNEYKEIIRELDNSAAYFDDTETSAYLIINLMMDDVLFSSDYASAYDVGKDLDPLLDEDNIYGVIRSLVCALKRIDVENNKLIKKAIYRRDFKYIADFYEKKEKERPLSADEEIILHLAKTIYKTILLDEITYSPGKYDGSSFYIATLCFNFFEAYKLLPDKASMSGKDFIIDILLKEIIDLEMKLTVRKSGADVPSKAIDLIKERDYENALRFLEIYFEKDEKKIKLGEYVLYWILIQDDIDDISTRLLFRDIKDGTFGRNIDRFIKFLHETQDDGNFIEAKLIIDILKSYDENLIEQCGLGGIEEKVQSYMEKNQYKDIKSVILQLLEYSKKNGKKIGYVVGKRYAHKKDVWGLLEKISNEGGAFIYTSKDENELIELERVIKRKYYNIHTRRITYFGKPSIIVKHDFNYGVDTKDMYTNAKEAFKNGDLATSKKLYLTLLAQYEKPYSIIYKRLAEISEMEGNYASAVDYYKLYSTARYEEGRPDSNYANKKEEEDKYIAYVLNLEVKQRRREEQQRYKEYNTFADILFEDYSSLDELTKRMRLSSEEVKIVKILLAKRCIDHDMIEEAKKIVEPIRALDDNSDEVIELLDRLPIENLSESLAKLNRGNFIIKPKKQVSE